VPVRVESEGGPGSLGGLLSLPTKYAIAILDGSKDTNAILHLTC
jgi:hypothetical protein